MPNSSKTFRLFLSSTFNDMRAERDKLQEKVFPELRTYCEERGFIFQPVDLRWGVSFEAGFDQKTMEICLDEVKRCKDALNPHFAVMLGERYGWIPLPAQIEAKEFELVKEVVLTKYADDKIVIDYINTWYQKDENNFPAQYKLKARVKKKHQDWGYWGDVENKLREAFRSVVKEELKDKLSDDQKFKYIKSATEQEIIEGLFHNENIAKENIYFYNRDFEYIEKLTPDEFATLEAKDKKYRKKIEEHNAKNPNDKKAAYEITVKHFSDFKQLPDGKFDNILDDEIRQYHHELIEKIKSDLPKENVKEYKLKLDPSKERTQDSVTEEHLEKFAKDFKETILASMKKEIDARLNREQEDKNDIEKEQQKVFLDEKAKIFVGREEFLSKISNFIKSDETTTPLVIHADSGSGKSALMAKVIQDTIKDSIDDNVTIAYRFVGTSELSNNPLNLYKSLYTELIEDEILKKICVEYIQENELEEDKVLSDLKELSKVIANLLENYPEDKKLILFVDALDQFMINDPLDWLPRVIVNNVKVIISTLPDKKEYENIQYLPKLKQKYSKNEENFLFLEAFDSDEASSMVDEYLSKLDNPRKLTSSQKEKVLNSFLHSKERSPLYLKILLEEASQWASYTDISNEVYPKELDDLIARLFKRLHTHSHHSLPLVNYAFAYIACSKDGLPEPELFDILSQEKNIMDDVSNEFYPRPSRLPTAVWARLYSQMAHYLSVKEVDGMDQISFFHRKFNEGAYKLNLNFTKDKDGKYITDTSKQTTKEDIHKNLAEFYRKVYDKDEKFIEQKVQTTEESALTELPYQLIMSNQKKASLELLTNFEFLMKKFKLNRTSEVLEDYALAKAMGMNDE